MIRAIFETPRVLIEAFGTDRDEAMQLLVQAWARYAGTSGADADYLDEYIDDVQFCEVVVGAAYLDHHERLITS